MAFPADPLILTMVREYGVRGVRESLSPVPIDRVRIDRRSFLLGAAAPFAIPATARQSGVIEAPIQVGDHRVSIEARLNGRGPYSLVIDTGAEISGLKVEVARDLGLRPQRTVRLAGGVFQVYAIEELVLGGVVRQSGAAFFGLDDSPALGGDGLLSAGLLTTVDSELQYEARRWRAWPSGMPAQEGYEPIAARVVAAQAEGLSSRLHGPVRMGETELDAVWDTGGPHGLSLSRAEAGRLGLMAPDRPFAPIPSRSIRGLAPIPARMVAAPPIRVGSETFNGARAVVRMDDVHAGAAILGFPVLRGLDLTVADQGRRIGVRRNGLQPVNLPYSLSGLWVEEARGGVRVEIVGTGSPAAEAGLRSGDLITNLGSFPEALRTLRGPGGASVPVSFRREGETRTAVLALRDYLSG